MTLEKIAVIGAGNGGQATAVDLTTRGFGVCLYEFPDFSKRLESKLASKKIHATGFIKGEISIDRVTLDASEAADYSKTVIVAMPAYGHSRFFNVFGDLLQDDSRVYIFPGNLATLMAPMQTIRDMLRRGVKITEFNTLPYGSRIMEDGTVNVSILATLLSYAAFPAINNPVVSEEISKIYPVSRPNQDILQVSLNNPNPLIHPPGVLFNIGRIEHTNGHFYMYNEGMTDSIRRVIEAVDKERNKIGQAFGYKLIGLEEFDGMVVGGSRKSFIDCGKDSLMLGPTSRDNRYITEDVPFGLVYWSRIARRVGIEIPNVDAIITLASTICGFPFVDEGKSIEEFPGDILQIKHFLKYGTKL